MKKLTTLLIVTFFPLFVFACDICGNFNGITPYDNQSSLQLIHRYRLFSHLNVSGQPYLPSGAYRIDPTFTPQHTGTEHQAVQKGDFESFKVVELRGRIFVHRRIEAGVQVSWVQSKSRMYGVFNETSGLGDATVSIGYHLLRRLDDGFRFKQRLVLGAGVKLPVGKSSAYDVNGVRKHLYFQNGTGSVDEIVYLQHVLGFGKFGSSVTLSSKFSGRNNFEEQLKPAFTLNGSVFWQWSKEKFRIAPQIQFYGEHTKGLYVNDVYEQHSGMTMLMGGIGTDIFFGQLGVHTGFQLPLYEVTHDSDPSATFRAMFGVSWSFNQTEYLINK
jgi:hypothetical protein